ncbi:dihydrofolate reductase [Companilactobacillus crustorum]|uniref:Dihydrofolate reductase n=3 Tax=Companilactobacillus TaxID=2767879 RepID=A0A837RFI2_9LACO|nr:dihydrofolate reductase [Companilactobacillus crustorum]HCD07931.1 dihydrofolate reductase [Lactobacillus sp.]APU71440.1 Dihydrofolate reductase [Companilactobacillus crustorum]KRK41445.1 dihydrofolate reductase [Companilactobacillus crustorum JCM 15951]KRO19120.1 dihydrofolate reductase [Companilactobacillus crustorum]WDT66532.1 dihydrofolate reductase [Companilactobacillus crustorum]
MISFVWAEDRNHIIGKNGHLPWKLPNDMKHFKNVTMGHPIVMGRRTYESFPNGPLPNRLNIVISRNPNYRVPDSVVLITDKNELSHYVQSDEEVMVIGGEGIFKLFQNDVDRLYLTRIDYDFTGDTKMVNIDYNQFNLIEKKEGIVDDKNVYPHTFETYQKI